MTKKGKTSGSKGQSHSCDAIPTRASLTSNPHIDGTNRLQMQGAPTFMAN